MRRLHRPICAQSAAVSLLPLADSLGAGAAHAHDQKYAVSKVINFCAALSKHVTVFLTRPAQHLSAGHCAGHWAARRRASKCAPALDSLRACWAGFSADLSERVEGKNGRQNGQRIGPAKRGRNSSHLEGLRGRKRAGKGGFSCCLWERRPQGALRDINRYKSMSAS